MHRTCFCAAAEVCSSESVRRDLAAWDIVLFVGVRDAMTDRATASGAALLPARLRGQSTRDSRNDSAQSRFGPTRSCGLSP
jgi:hypothetical protein